MTIINDIHETHLTTKIQNIENFLREVNIKQRALFHEICDEVFNSCPSLNTISWTQYTPYFNDGDPCIFNIQNEVSFSKDEWIDVDPFQSYEKSDEELEKCEEITMFENFMYNEVDTLGQLFGEDVFVRIHKDGIQVDEYGEHD